MSRRKAEGAKWNQLAVEFGISERQARRAVADAQRISAEEGSLDDVRPLHLLHRIIEVQSRSLDRLAELMDDAQAARNANAVVGACRAAGSVGEALRKSLFCSGLLPSRVAFGPGDAVKFKREAETVTKAMIAVGDRVGVPFDLLYTELISLGVCGGDEA